MPIRKHLYPADWPAISLEVRTAAGWRCEWCGAPNKTEIQRRPQHRFQYPGLEKYDIDWVLYTHMQNADGVAEPTNTMTWKRLRFFGLTRIILTVAHLDRNPGNNEPENLAALCQRCHLRHDIMQHVRARKYGRAHEEQPKLFI